MIFFPSFSFFPLWKIFFPGFPPLKGGRALQGFILPLAVRSLQNGSAALPIPKPALRRIRFFPSFLIFKYKKKGYTLCYALKKIVTLCVTLFHNLVWIWQTDGYTLCCAGKFSTGLSNSLHNLQLHRFPHCRKILWLHFMLKWLHFMYFLLLNSIKFTIKFITISRKRGNVENPAFLTAKMKLTLHFPAFII